jgi:hypothetical protein
MVLGYALNVRIGPQPRNGRICLFSNFWEGSKMRVFAVQFVMCLIGIGSLFADLYAQPPRQSPLGGRQRGGGLRLPDRLKEGDVAPDFTLKSPDGKRTETLSNYRGKKPVALVFGSYT